MCIVQFNMGSAVHEDNCGMIIEETLSQTDDQEGNNDKRVRFISISLQLLLSLNGNLAAF